MVIKKASKDEKLQKLLLHKTKSVWNSFDEKKVFSFSEKYKSFLSVAKTERLSYSEILSRLKKSGFKNAENLKSTKKGDKLYYTFKNKTIFAFVVGKNKENLRLIGSHMDSPRLDLKPNPLVEDSGLALLKSHYYGGIKKYQWVNIPLALHGIVYLSSGKKLTLSIGEKESDPKFLIPDLLIHLSQNQMERKGNKIVQGEELQILFGSIPIKDSKYSEKIKLAVLKKLYDKYKLTEKDFVGAELEFVPALKPFDVGIDKSLIGAYGQDDHVCVFTSLNALLDLKKPNSTAATLFVDKEEIGSVGNTGAASFLLRNFAARYVSLAKLSITVDEFLQSALSVSADVGAGLNPIYKDVHDITNAPLLGRGPIIYKYKGVGGKSYTDDASAEYVHIIKTLFEKFKLPWQSAEGGRIDLGGGGTIAMYLSRYGMDTIDVGPAVLAMHSPCEVISKVDVYSSYLFYKAFLSD